MSENKELTFSNLSAVAFEQPGLAQKAGRKGPRKRDIISCSQCRSRKIRCDRENPCSQCRCRNLSAKCSYRLRESKSESRLATHARQSTNKASKPPQKSHSRQPSTPSLALARTVVATAQTPPFTKPHIERESSSSDAAPHNCGVKAMQSRMKTPMTGGHAFTGSGLETRIRGVTHWMAPCTDMPIVTALLNRSNEFTSAWTAFEELLALFEAEGMSNTLPAWLPLPLPTDMANHLRMLLPDRASCERWSGRYHQTYGRIFSIVDPVAVSADLDRAYTPPPTATDATIMGLQRVLLIMAIAMLDDDRERAEARQLARRIKDIMYLTTRLQRPCIGVMQVLLLLILAGTILASDTDKMYDLLGLYGVANQIALSMGLHRDPELCGGVSVYYAEVRKRLWACLVRLNLDYSIRSGTQLPLRLEDADCPLPAPSSLRTLDGRPSSLWEPRGQAADDAAFNRVAAKLAITIAPVHQALYAPVPRVTPTIQMDLRTVLATISAELPTSLRNGGQPGSSPDPVQELQQAIITTSMQTSMLVISLTLLFSSPPLPLESSRTSSSLLHQGHLLDLWERSISILDQFQRVCRHQSTTYNQSRHYNIGTDTHQNESHAGIPSAARMAFHLLWTSACRAALCAYLVVDRLRKSPLHSLSSHDNTGVSSTVTQSVQAGFALRQLFVKSLSFLCGVWQMKAAHGPVAAKTYLILAVVQAVVANLHDASNETDIRPRLFAHAAEAAEWVAVETKENMLAQRMSRSGEFHPRDSPPALTWPRPSEDQPTGAGGSDSVSAFLDSLENGRDELGLDCVEGFEFTSSISSHDMTLGEKALQDIGTLFDGFGTSPPPDMLS